MRAFLTSALAGCLLLGACDKVKNPIENLNPGIDTTLVDGSKKVLLEDYTGQLCGYCPGAADVANTLSKQYGDNLVVIAVHAGFFAVPDKNRGFPIDYRTTAGNEWRTYFKIDAFPNGIVNRKNYDDAGLIIKETGWGSAVTKGFQDPFYLRLDISPVLNAPDSLLDVTVKTTMAADYGNNIRVSVVLLEDSIIGPQLDYRNGDKTIPDYRFDHLMRGALNGTWGTLLKDGPMVKAEKHSFTLTGFKLKKPWRHSKLSVVAFAFDDKTREVLQAEKVHL